VLGRVKLWFISGDEDSRRVVLKGAIEEVRLMCSWVVIDDLAKGEASFS